MKKISYIILALVLFSGILGLAKSSRAATCTAGVNDSVLYDSTDDHYNLGIIGANKEASRFTLNNSAGPYTITRYEIGGLYGGSSITSSLYNNSSDSQNFTNQISGTAKSISSGTSFLLDTPYANLQGGTYWFVLETGNGYYGHPIGTKAGSRVIYSGSPDGIDGRSGKFTIYGCGHNFDVIACKNGETGICRESIDASQDNIQATIDSSSDGDGVYIPAGTVTWNMPIILTDKNIKIFGAGIDQTIINVNNQAFIINMTKGADGFSSTGMSVKKVSWRISGLTIQDAGSVPTDTYIIYMNSGNYDGPIMGWRLDHIKMNFPRFVARVRMILTYGIAWGLMDHMNFVNGGNMALSQQEGLSSEFYAAANAGITPNMSYYGNYVWGLPLNLGSDEAIYIEDSQFEHSPPDNNTINDMMSGASIVMRHNVINGATALYSHTGEGGTLGRGGAKKYEFYNNQCNGLGSFEWIGMQEDGTGVIYDNKVTGYLLNDVYPSVFRADLNAYTGSFYGNCWGPANFNYGGGATRSYDGNLESNGWPCLDQIGRGPGVKLGDPQPSVPLYLWNNGPQDKCFDPNAFGAACDGSAGVAINPANGTKAGTMNDYVKTTPHVNGDRDYCDLTTAAPINGITKCGNHTFNYTAYQYPHPLQGGVPPSVLYGDVDGNGSIAAYDAALVAQAAVGLITFTTGQIKAGDVDNNGSITAYDAALIAQKAVGLITKFPVE